ncbi:MAG TPA: FtsQ-type POTRA domain-containing protein [Intrasporangium sp.]|uniref:cell division protein FtsQ/DivIB n=1 Tax=Intrasporangium sp. TaxID=1925024 RepID=UPI002D792CF0|nr:FtsQ-type POTRA domain-containing protein [Intrasporangium sp.]HET7398524.1 FtsQ-type POTRA domain-containing protein [Intrasporangium sp.]
MRLHRARRGRSGSAALAGRGLRSARERFERRAAAARRRPWLVVAALLGALALAGLVVWVGWFSSLLTVTTVRVEGVAGATAAEVQRVAAVPLGQPVLRVDTEAVAARLDANRALTDITVRRSLPHTIVVGATAREAVLAMRNAAGQVEVVDAGGYAFKTVPSVPAGLPVVSATSSTVTPSGLKAALGALRALEPGTRRSVAGMTVNAADQVTFTLNLKDGPRTVVWGDLGNERVKSRLVAILAGQPGTTIDVSVPSSPVTR